MGPGDANEFRNRKIELFSRLRLRNVFPGEAESIFTGDGIDFAAIRALEPGDDLRDLNLHTLAQSGEEEIVERAMGRQRRTFIWADWSGSMQRAPEMLFWRKPDIREMAIGLLVYSAWNSYSPVGFCAFGDKIHRYFPARSGERFCQEILRWVVDHESRFAPTRTDIPQALAFLVERARPQSLVLFISDFHDRAFQGDFADLFKPVAKKFDVVPVVIRDPLETNSTLKQPVRIDVRDSEGDSITQIYLTPRKLAQIQEVSARHLRHLQSNFRAIGMDHVILDTPTVDGCYQALAVFFEGRKRTRG